MSEEKPTFKITDRRLFNPDGTPRDVAREEEPAPAAPTSPLTTETSAAGGATAEERSTAGTSTAPRSTAAEAAPPNAPPRAGAPAGAESEERRAPTGGDPTPFANLVMFLASPAAAALGMTEHPGLSGRDIDLPLAKHCIDLLATLRQKTSGNLSPQEEQIIESLLAELRMQYVSMARPGGMPGAGGAPRGFSGSDITGGR